MFKSKVKLSSLIATIMCSVAVLTLTSICIILSSFKSEKNAKAESTITLNTTDFGPITGEVDEVEITYTYSVNTTYQRLISSFAYGRSSSEIFSASSKPSHSAVPNQTYTATFTYNARDYFDGKPMYFRVRLVERGTLTSTTVIERSCTIYPPGNDNVNVNQYIKKYWNSKPLGFRIQNNELIELADVYVFFNTLDYLNLDYYYRLDLSSFNFINGNDNFSYASAELIFFDDDNLFRFYSKRDDGYIHIPLRIIQNEGNISVRYARSFYVHPKTLDMSDVRISGYVGTAYFYFPVNGLEKMINYQFVLKINEFSMNKTNLQITLDYDTTQRLIGPCSISDYCIVGGLRT